jgi:signal transduction histidine kinase
MLWPKFKNNLYFRFQFVVTSAIFFLCFLLFISYALYKQASLKDEIKLIIQNEATNILSTHQEERKRRDFHTLQRYLQQIPHVETAILYDKDCKLLNTTFLSDFQNLTCNRISKKFISIIFQDVISPIGRLVVHPKYPSYSIFEFFLGFLSSIGLGFFSSWFISLAWRKFVYTPLHTELDDLSNGKTPQIQELGEIGIQIRSLINQANNTERIVERAKFKEEKAQQALKIAHDLISPINLIQNDSNLSHLAKSSRRAIEDLQSIAYSLLPEKNGFQKSSFSLTELIKDAIDQASSNFINLNIPIVEIQNDIFIVSSRIHLLRSLTNIVKNAIEVEPANSCVLVKTYVLNGKVLIDVIDHGTGFDPNKVNGSSKLTGSGLGISSAKSSLLKLSGDLEYISSPEGTLARISLPLSTEMDFYSNQIVLIEDDKYVIQNWVNEAKKNGIKLRVYNNPNFDISSDEIVYYDRFLDGVDIDPKVQALISTGIKAYSISAIDNPNGKTPPWLTTPPV